MAKYETVKLKKYSSLNLHCRILTFLKTGSFFFSLLCPVYHLLKPRKPVCELPTAFEFSIVSNDFSQSQQTEKAQ